MIRNDDRDLHLVIETGPGRTETHPIRAWDADSGAPLVLDRFGGLVAASLLGAVLRVAGN